MAGGEGFGITPDELHKVAGELNDIAGRTRQAAAAFGDAQQGISGRAPGFAIIASAAECGALWKLAVQTQADTLSVDADLLGVTADAYAQGEQIIASSFGGR